MRLGDFELGPNDTPENGIYTGDARELAKGIPDESVDLIFTDPPYHKKYLPLYKWAAQMARRILSQDGFLLIYCGNYFKDDIMQSMRQYLSYFFDFALMHGSYGTAMLWPKRIAVKHKSLLSYNRGNGAKPRAVTLSAWIGGGDDKRYHAWGQGESEARYYIDCFTQEGSIVVDPFCGGGTTVAMCSVLKRHWLAFEIDPATAEVARERVRNTQPPLFVPQPEQVEMEFA